MSGPGYSITEKAFSDRECDELVNVLATINVGRGRAGARHLMAHAIVAATARDPRLVTIARSFLGDAVVPYRATLFEKSDQANWLVVWHQDTALPLTCANNYSEWGPWSHKAGIIYAHAPTWALARTIALRLHLDASTADNGPLRIIPGSHAAGVLSDEDVFHLARKQESMECIVPKGGVLAMRPLLIHSSSKSKADMPRRVLHIEYVDSLDLGEGIRLAVA